MAFMWRAVPPLQGCELENVRAGPNGAKLFDNSNGSVTFKTFCQNFKASFPIRYKCIGSEKIVK